MEEVASGPVVLRKVGGEAKEWSELDSEFGFDLALRHGNDWASSLGGFGGVEGSALEGESVLCSLLLGGIGGLRMRKKVCEEGESV